MDDAATNFRRRQEIAEMRRQNYMELICATLYKQKQKQQQEQQRTKRTTRTTSPTY